MIDKWRTERMNIGRSKQTVNVDIATFKAALSKAVEWEILDENPLRKLKLLQVDHHPSVRYLSVDEEQQLRKTLMDRETKVRLARDNANHWRDDRGYSLLPTISADKFADHLRPMVLLSINTGIRQGELFSLTWEDIDFKQATITIAGYKAKSGKTRYVPLNSESMSILQTWFQQANDKTGLVFPSQTKNPFDNVRKSWQKVTKQANTEHFRWHDLRHHFASKLVMAGVDLNTVRELLGHSDIKMTLRYAHLAPAHKANAVEKLVSGVLINERH